MSLVNDALKRAKQMQQNMRKQSQPELPPRPAGPVVTQPTSPAWIWAAFFAFLLAASGYLVWQTTSQDNPRSADAASNDTLIVHAATAPRAAAKPAAVKTNAVETAVRPAPLKLQSIFYIPGRSSVMISGESLSVGGQIRNFRVVEIKPDSVTLADATETKVLKLH